MGRQVLAVGKETNSTLEEASTYETSYVLYTGRKVLLVAGKAARYKTLKNIGHRGDLMGELDGAGRQVLALEKE